MKTLLLIVLIAIAASSIAQAEDVLTEEELTNLIEVGVFAGKCSVLYDE